MMATPVVMADPRTDPYREGLAAGWRVIDASAHEGDLTLDADVVIVGTGAGGGTAAEILAQAGRRVVMIEEGPLISSSAFRMRESDAYPNLYQDCAARKTRDRAINILQGRCVGGGTTVNWTSCFRTPERTLEHWARAFGIRGFSPADMAPWFERMETRLSIAPWEVAPNANNEALRRGGAALGIPVQAIRRNVKGCWNLGYCGVGCPTNAKQSMLVTTIPSALAVGATLVTRVRAWTLEHNGDRIVGLDCLALDAQGAPNGRRVRVRADTYVAAAGAIGSPALLLRSRLPDPHSVVGTRTFLHPSLVSAALMPDPVDGFSGAPQSAYSDHFLDSIPFDGPMGFKLEAPPLHPILVATTLPAFGAEHAHWMRELPRMQVLIALMRDGFDPRSSGGTVRVDGEGAPHLDYPLDAYFWDGARRALAAMAEIQFAAGAVQVMPLQGGGASYAHWPDARAGIASAALAPLQTTVVSAHVMGGCALGPDPRHAVVDTQGRHHHLANLYVIDGSLLPTSIAANPQLSIYGLSARLASGLVGG
jgi:choline dehydrogenase-like flavoprotein